jgi:energy-coupling factor transport system substrate-specific component
VNRGTSWRTVDIVVTAAIAVAFGVVFWAWNLLWEATKPAFLAAPPAQNILYGVWLAAGVVAGLVVRKPGAALFAELVAAAISALLLGSPWGLDTLLSGAVQGVGAEIGFAIFLYRKWNLASAIAAAALSAVGAWLHDTPLYYAEIGLSAQLVIGAFMLISAVVIAGVGSWWLFRALLQTGVLAQLPAGREQQRI